MRATVEITEEQHRALTVLAHRRGIRGCSPLVQEAIDGYLNDVGADDTESLLALTGVLDDEERAVRARIHDARSVWRTRVVVVSDLLIDFLSGRGAGGLASRQDDILALLHRRTIPLDAMAACERAGCRLRSVSQGRPIGRADCLQSGLCLRHGLALATRNRTRRPRRRPGTL